jgi:hypothetical protein
MSLRRLGVVLLVGLTACGATAEVPSPSDSSPASSESVAGFAIVYDLVGASGADATAQAVARLQDRAAAMSIDATVSAAAGGGVQVVVSGMDAAREEVVAQSLASVGAVLQVRPVLSQCQVLGVVPSGTTTVPIPVQVSDPATEQMLQVLGADPPEYCMVGPAQGTGALFSDNATAMVLPGAGWGVVADLRPGADGQDVWNAVAAQCYDRAATCPTEQLAMELDGVLLTVATVQTPHFEGSIQISGNFDELQARAIADSIVAGALPFRLQVASTGG